MFRHKIHHLDRKGKLRKTTAVRVIMTKGKPMLIIKHYTDVNKFVYGDYETPYPQKDLPEDVKREYAYLMEEEKPVKEVPVEPMPVPEPVEVPVVEDIVEPVPMTEE